MSYQMVAIPHSRIDRPDVNADMKFKLKNDLSAAIRNIDERYGGGTSSKESRTSAFIRILDQLMLLNK